MTVIVVITFACVSAAAIIRFGGMRRRAVMPVLGALLIGCFSWSIAGRPAQPGAPIQRAQPEGMGDPIEDPRHGMTARFGAEAQWLGLSDGMLRNGRTDLATRVLAQGVRRFPRSVDLWVGYGNALFAHADGAMTPASAMAFDRAAAIDPSHPAPDFFRGLAFAQSGDLASAEEVWQSLLERAPQDAPYRADLLARIAQIRAALSASRPTLPPGHNR
jgi:cytochrome c-type biogenesis protein CcmH